MKVSVIAVSALAALVSAVPMPASDGLAVRQFNGDVVVNGGDHPIYHDWKRDGEVNGGDHPIFHDWKRDGEVGVNGGDHPIYHDWK
ncbi:hypothetical protein CSOJ01_05603 [Colletotrichum sojae]|uniref:Uncharacterized protein n=1 Tax=Colletotrichum sojae TaxID=2175907 RepID=A0A8H6JEH4_9PEZI|nr:hypothetical protein CSOJ01_05603 [Colletotrichum sojae]